MSYLKQSKAIVAFFRISNLRRKISQALDTNPSVVLAVSSVLLYFHIVAAIFIIGVLTPSKEIQESPLQKSLRMVQERNFWREKRFEKEPVPRHVWVLVSPVILSGTVLASLAISAAGVLLFRAIYPRRKAMRRRLERIPARQADVRFDADDHNSLRITD